MKSIYRMKPSPMILLMGIVVILILVLAYFIKQMETNPDDKTIESFTITEMDNAKIINASTRSVNLRKQVYNLQAQ